MFVEYNNLLTLSLMVIWSLAYPSYMSLALLCWTMPFWLYMRRMFFEYMPHLLFFSAVYIFVQFISSLAPLAGQVLSNVVINCVAHHSLQSMGTVIDVHQTPSTRTFALGAKILMFLFFCVTCYLRVLAVNDEARREWQQNLVTAPNSPAVNTPHATHSPIPELADEHGHKHGKHAGSPIGQELSKVAETTVAIDEEVFERDRISETSSISSTGSLNRFLNQYMKLERLRQLLGHIMSALQSFWTFAVANLYIAVLVLIYFCVLEEVSVINAGYVVILIVFATHPPIARHSWWFLVIYTEFQILIEYIWGFPFTDGISDSINNIIGVESDSHSNLWTLLKWDIAIFSLAIVQYHVYLYAAKARTDFSLFDSRPSAVNTVELETNVEQSEPLESKLVKTIGALARKFAGEYWILIVCVTFLVATLSFRITMIKLGFVLLFCLFLNTSQVFVNKARLSRGLWFIVLAYSAGAFVLMYLFQFQRLSNAVIDITSRNATSAKNTLDDIGLTYQDSQAERFTYLV